MKKDNKHNLSLDRIAKLHSIDLERGAQLHQDIKNCILLSDGGGIGGEQGNKEGQDQLMMIPPGRNAQKWQDKFEDLRRYKELHAE